MTNQTEAELSRARLANAIVEAYLDRRPSTEAFAIGSATDASQRHLVLYSTKTKEQVILERLETAGTYDPGPNPLARHMANVGGQPCRAARPAVGHPDRDLDSDGSARVLERSSSS